MESNSSIYEPLDENAGLNCWHNLNLNWFLSYPVNHIVNINLLVMELVTFFYIKPTNSINIHNKIYQTI